jgi:hypothetical protein
MTEFGLLEYSSRDIATSTLGRNILAARATPLTVLFSGGERSHLRREKFLNELVR